MGQTCVGVRHSSVPDGPVILHHHLVATVLLDLDDRRAHPLGGGAEALVDERRLPGAEAQVDHHLRHSEQSEESERWDDAKGGMWTGKGRRRETKETAKGGRERQTVTSSQIQECIIASQEARLRNDQFEARQIHEVHWTHDHNLQHADPASHLEYGAVEDEVDDVGPHAVRVLVSVRRDIDPPTFQIVDRPADNPQPTTSGAGSDATGSLRTTGARTELEEAPVGTDEGVAPVALETV